MASGSSASRSSTPVARVGQIIERSIPMSFMSMSRGSGSKKASTEGMPRRCCGSASAPPGGATRAKVGLGMKSLILSLKATFVRLLISTYFTTPSNSGGMNLVRASVFSYMWLSASNTGYGRRRSRR
jgi:hypothetical protein